MKLAIGTDHRGFALKEQLIKQHRFADVDVTWFDQGTMSTERTDYPPYAAKVCRLVLDKQVDGGLLLCGSGVGMSIAANRFRGIFAALAWNEQIARLSKRDDNANILVLPADVLTIQQATSLISIWLATPFAGNEYQRRLDMVDRL
jgi:ribose 5-phosphate isomerase B